MTHAILQSMNILDSVMKNASMQTPTADSLINAMRVGALDAAVVYQVNVQTQKEHFASYPAAGRQGARGAACLRCAPIRPTSR